MNEKLLTKLRILAASAKYDASCASSGTDRRNTPGGIGNAAAAGICHSFTDDGRCVSLLKILYTNHCLFDCAYCVNRRSNDLPRTSFTVRELVELTLEFYRRNYIEGLFLSSAVAVSPDHTMERMIRVVQLLRATHAFNGYIHMKSIPGASRELVLQAGLYADRLSVNVEIPSERNLKRLAPEKDHKQIYEPMRHIQQGQIENFEERKKSRHAPRFVPAGQSTQMIIGASDERDTDILKTSSLLYSGLGLKRVYYSAFIPVNAYDTRLPAVSAAPLARENRLYQADWLMRLYHFSADELADDAHPYLDPEIDPKLAWALRHPEYFPCDANTADYSRLLRIPGVGLRSAQRIIAARRHCRLDARELARMGVVMKRAKYFLRCNGTDAPGIQEAGPATIRNILRDGKKNLKRPCQFSLFAAGETAAAH
ncbi:MAG: putative DNA modification/repair radical SAM protein [Desulfovibrio sp.]|jgi:putative DNA modification/repair radical SAM protein|nr:putative DNA modification/repair radical SAM protein [Desulfovibrio sp.]